MLRVRRCYRTLARMFALLLWGGSDASHIGFALPPFSPAGPMMPVVHGCLDSGHKVTVFAHSATVAKMRPLAPGAEFVDVGPAQRPELDEWSQGFILSMPYTVMPLLSIPAVLVGLDTAIGWPLAQATLPELRRRRPDVLCTCNLLSSVYAAGEAAGVPVVGLSFGPQVWMTILDAPWSSAPALGSWYSEREIAGNLALTALNTAARAMSVPFCVVGSVMYNLRRLRLGLTTLQSDAFDSMWSNPLVVPTLPELLAGHHLMSTPNMVMAGMYDHPALAGVSLGKSAQQEQITAWLDAKFASGTEVVYAAFGSEVTMDNRRLKLFMEAFRAGNITVLWALKKVPADLDASPNVFVTPWAPQKVVLEHPAVKVFLSHGGTNSVRESLVAGTPLLIMPVMPDCPSVAAMHEELGVALRLDKNGITPEVVVGAVRKLSSEGYQARAREVRELNERHASLARAVEVVEAAARRGLQHEASAETGYLPVWQSVVMLFFIGNLCSRAMRRCCCCCCRPRSGAVKSKLE
mmetsp:Transcript_85243/g.246080  ORF Transcript_85243/g.246080 Transcript_85243/m.246080 type:complete len:521 (+) Transcript_85243:86-1648(+)